jgi:pimeloyl-ACP methyl ester carboxylesterase
MAWTFPAPPLGRGHRCCFSMVFHKTKPCGPRVAPELAKHYSVVCADLRGYGDSAKPECLPDCSNYSFRALATDQVGLMRALGFERFHVIGHDRGGRTGHRMALDHPEAVLSLTGHQSQGRGSLLALVFPIATTTVSRACDRRRSRFFLRDMSVRLGRHENRGFRSRDARRVPPGMAQSRDDPRLLLRLPCRRWHRPRTRCGRHRSSNRMSGARFLRFNRHDGGSVRHTGGMAKTLHGGQRSVPPRRAFLRGSISRGRCADARRISRLGRNARDPVFRPVPARPNTKGIVYLSTS